MQTPAASSKPEKRRTNRLVPPPNADLAGLLVCFFSILSICLTAFNVYLLVWLCSALTGSGQTSGLGLGLLDKLELLQVDDEWAKFANRLLVKRPLVAGTVVGAASVLQLTSASKISFKAANLSSSFSVGPQRASLEFPAGLRVFGRGARGAPLIECGRPRTLAQTAADDEPESAPVCRLRPRRVRLTGRAGVDLAAVGSIQARSVRTRRLHSPLHRLQLVSGAKTTLESLDDELQLQALDLLALGQRESAVIIKAHSLALAAGAEEQKARPGTATSSGAGPFRLCVCLFGRRGAGDNRAPDDRPPNNGRVFAIRDKLKCSKFSERFCNSPREQHTRA